MMESFIWMWNAIYWGMVSQRDISRLNHTRIFALNVTIASRVSENDRIVMQLNSYYLNFLTNLDLDRFSAWCLPPGLWYCCRLYVSTVPFWIFGIRVQYQ
jgi:hypothetical protein